MIDDVSEFLQRPLTIPEYHNARKYINQTKSSTKDVLDLKFINNSLKIVHDLLFFIMETFWNNASVPSTFRRYDSHPLFKKGDKELMTNYRGIGNIDSIRKTYHMIIVNMVEGFLVKKNVFLPSQAAYLKGKEAGFNIFSLMTASSATLKVPLYIYSCDQRNAYDKL